MPKKFRFTQKQIQQNPYKTQSFTYISHKYPQKEKALGKLLLFLSYEDNQNNEKFTKFLAELERIYYEKSKFNHFPKTHELEKIFEQSLKNFNQQFTWLYQSKRLTIDFKKINILVAVVRENTLLFSQVNRMDLFITYLSKENKTKIINIAEPADSRTPLPSSMKLFANLITGDLSSSSNLLITNKNLSKYLSLYKLKNTLLYPSSREINYQLSKSVKQISNSDNFAWLLVKKEEVEEEEMNNDYPVNDLSDDTTDNEKSSAKNKKEKFINLRQKFCAWHKKFKNKNQKKENVKQNVFDETIEINFGSKMKKMLTALPFGPNNKGANQYALPWHKRLKKNIKDLITYPWFIRFGFIFLIAAIVIFAYSTFYLKNQKEIELAQQAYEEEILNLKNQLANARANLLYGDKEATEEIYKQLSLDISKLNDDTEQAKIDKTSLEKELNSLYNDLYNITELKNWNTISDLNNFVVDNITYTDFILLNNNLISFGGKSKLMLNTNLQNGESEFIENTSSTIQNLKLASTLETQENKIYFWSKNQNIWEWDHNKNLLENLDTIIPEDMEASAMASYSKNLYFIDPVNNQIQKFVKTTSGFSKGRPWIMDQDLPNLKKVVDLAIDSNIYLLYENG